MFSLKRRIKNPHEEFEQFVKKREEEDHSKVVEAMLEKKKAEEQAAKEFSGKSLTIGYPIKDEAIPIEGIVDEERRITIQGLVFDSEIRELRSGRSLLTFKVTDYTDSILIKIFSRDKEDLPLLNAVKKGMWLKVRGGIQNDTFVRDLVMIANDINQIEADVITDDAEEKRVELHLHSSMSQMDGMTGVGRYVKQAAALGS